MPPLSAEVLDALARCDTPSVIAAIDSLGVRLRHHGFTQGSVACRNWPGMPMVGHAVTATVRTSTPPPLGHAYLESAAWWDFIESIPRPRIVVLADVDPERRGLGALVDELHVGVLAAVGCAGVLTDGAVIDGLARIANGSFHAFSRSLSPSPAYAHIVDIGGMVEIDGLTIGSGDLLHGDRSGVALIPPGVAAQVPSIVERQRQARRRVIEACRATPTGDAIRRNLAAYAADLGHRPPAAAQ